MPPRKKPVSESDAPAPTRSSSRIKANAEAQPAKPPSKVAAKPKSTAKRARKDDDDDDEEEDDAPKKPASKRVKKSDEDAPVAKPASKKPVSKKPASRAKKTKADTEDEQDDAPIKPASKRTKKQADDSEDDAPVAKPVSKKAKMAKVDEEDEEEPPAKMVTLLKRGAAPVDPKSGKVSTHQVYHNAEGVWDAMLNQTDISGGSNKNKFYALQLLHPIGSNSNSILYTHWGRVGEEGQSQVKGPFPAANAVAEFKKQFKAKAGVNWEERVGMVPKKGKYVWLERSYGDDDEEEEVNAKAEGSKAVERPIPKSSLPSPIQEFIMLVFSTSIMDSTLSSMNYDARKLPLGKLSKNTILNGFAALKRLSEVLSDPNCDTAKESGKTLKEAVDTLTSHYYSIIPHEFGRSKPASIDTAEKLKVELNLVDALGDMEIASKLIQSSSALSDENGNPLNPLDSQFRSLGLSKMEHVDRNSQEFTALAAYARDTHGQTHRHINASVKHIYRVERPGETERWHKGGYSKLADGERMLLWHGSRTTNFAGILQQGLRIAPPEAPVNGYMFGKGVYFADMMSKSAGYCYPSLSNNVGLLLLCEVAILPVYECDDADYYAAENCKKGGKRATKGRGRTQPTKWKDAGAALDNPELVGCHMPDGGGSDVATGGYLQYNEYIVYDISQIRVKYLLMVDM